MLKLKSLPHTIQQLLLEVLGRLENDYGYELVSISLSLLFCARNGKYKLLSESDCDVIML